MPTTWTSATKRLVMVAIVLLGLFILYLGRGLLTPLILAVLLALILSPVINFFHRRLGFRHGLAVATAYLLFLAVIIVVPLLFVPALIRSAAALDVAAIVTSINEWVIDTLFSLRSVRLLGSEIDLSASVDPILDAIQEGGEGFSFDLAAVFGGAWNITSAVFTGLIGALATMFLSLVISIYLAGSVDRRARLRMYALVPAGHDNEVRILGARIARVWTSYLSGQLTVAVVVGILTALIMFGLGVPGALVIGVIGGFLNLIPTFGPIFASVVAAAVALVQGSYRLDVGNVVFALIVVGAYVVIQQVESSILTPRILGEAVDVSPLAILLGILVGFGAAGVLGAIVAVPVVATGREVLQYVQAKLTDQEPFPEGPPPPRRTLKSRLKMFRKVDEGAAHPDEGAQAASDQPDSDGQQDHARVVE